MKFLMDAQLPRRLAVRLNEAGYDALHTLDLPDGNRTTDAQILQFAASEQRIIVTKDADFVQSFQTWKVRFFPTSQPSLRRSNPTDWWN